VNDPAKGELLEKRAERACADTHRCPQFTVVSKERIRNHFLAQAIFVPGIASIYHQLLSEQGQEICRLLPDFKGVDPGALLTFRETAHALYRHEPRLILFGVELRSGENGERELILNPQPGEQGFQFRAGDLVAICAVGDTDEFPRKGKRCMNCLKPRGAGTE
jgi:hypothetical protein